MSSKTKLHYSGCNHIPGVQPKCPECTIERLTAEKQANAQKQWEAACEVYRASNERLTAERNDFYMDYRVKCDEETKAALTEIERMTAERDDLQYANDFCGKTIERLHESMQEMRDRYSEKCARVEKLEAANAAAIDAFRNHGLIHTAQFKELLAATEQVPYEQRSAREAMLSDGPHTLAATEQGESDG